MSTLSLEERRRRTAGLKTSPSLTQEENGKVETVKKTAVETKQDDPKTETKTDKKASSDLNQTKTVTRVNVKPSDSVDKPVTSKTLSQSTTQTPKPVTAPTDKKQIVVQIQDNNTIKDICTRSQVISIITCISLIGCSVYIGVWAAMQD